MNHGYFRAGWVSLASLLLGLAGCQRAQDNDRYAVLGGRVASLQPTSGELILFPFDAASPGDTLYCVITQDSEIYINDRFSAIEEINIGDAVDLVGYRDTTPPLERFVVATVYVRQARSPASVPAESPLANP